MKKTSRNSLLPLFLLAVALIAARRLQHSGTTTDSSAPGKVTAADTAVRSKTLAASVRGGEAGLCAPITDRPEQMLVHRRFTVSYNRLTGCPNYVSWQLTAQQTEGHVRRDGADFLPDPLLPETDRITAADYRGSGYDRGHMCPAADNRYDARAMTECFYMTNICPQDHSLNAGPWATLEKACRRWAVQEDTLYIVCGPLFSDRPAAIGHDRRVSVPRGFFKCVLSLRAGAEKAIGFVYDNTSDRQPIDRTATTVDEVERLTGLDFFAALPDGLERRVESSCSLKVWH